MRILVYRALSQNDVLTAMSEGLARGLAEHGAETTLLALDGEDWLQTLAGTLDRGRFDHVLAFGSFSADLVAAGGRSLFDVAGCGFVGWDFDHPAYQYRRFSTPIRRRLQIAASQSHLDFARLIGSTGAERLMLPAANTVVDDPAPLEARPVAIAVAMSWLGEPQRWWAEWKGTPAYALIEGVVERLLADEEADILRAYRGALEATGNDIALDENLCNILARIALFVRQYDRLGVAKTLVEAGVPCTICGNGWRERLGEHAHISYAADLAYSDLGELYGRARTVVNLNAANGGSERAILGMACGALVVSDSSPLLRTTFEPSGAIRLFDRRRPETLVEAAGGSGAQVVADAGWAGVRAAHRWSDRAEALLAALAGPI